MEIHKLYDQTPNVGGYDKGLCMNLNRLPQDNVQMPWETPGIKELPALEGKCIEARRFESYGPPIPANADELSDEEYFKATGLRRGYPIAILSSSPWRYDSNPTWFD